MSLAYRIMYRVGFTPWDTGQVPDELRALVEGPEALPVGRALDVGCGTGTQAVYLARSGWQVTAVDAILRALAQASDRGRAAGVSVGWILADLAAPGSTLLPMAFAPNRVPRTSYRFVRV